MSNANEREKTCEVGFLNQHFQFQKCGLELGHKGTCRSKRSEIKASIRGLTQFHNSPAMCVTCGGHATCLQQQKAKDTWWEWHCDGCCTHDRAFGGVCIPAQNVPMQFAEGSELSLSQERELDEAIRIIGRLTGANMFARIRNRIKNGMESRTCFGCSGVGRIRSRFLLWTKSCPRCDGEGEVLVPQEKDEEI